MNNFQILSSELSISSDQVKVVVDLLDEGSTIPFLSRYRKEKTGGLDEVVIGKIKDGISRLRDLDKRRDSILKSIEEQGKLTPELKRSILDAKTMVSLEDLYLPYKPKRKTRASIAREHGLEPLALQILKGDVDPDLSRFYGSEKDIKTKEQALEGSRDIIAEIINEDAHVREKLRRLFDKKSTLTSTLIKSKESEASKFKDYFDWSENLKDAPGHRYLAIMRGEEEKLLRVSIEPDEPEAIQLISRGYLNVRNNRCRAQLETAISESYKRLLKPSLQSETRAKYKLKADEEAIKVFSENLEQLLLAAPIGQKATMAIDPGFRTGCKVVCLDQQGSLLEDAVIYPNEPQKDVSRAQLIVHELVTKHQIEVIVIGNGTAGRETELFVRALGLPETITIAMISENGASVYSASEIAREEFPNKDVTVRGAVSIGRRAMDPLAELVKIDPKSIGVGQYQHDVNQSLLKKSLDNVVTNCVNKVGVELNTASKQLLTYVAGLGPQLAENVINFREQNGPFNSRIELKDVPKLGAKAFEQCAGFLRIREAKNLLDRSGVHPERYSLVNQIRKDLGSDLVEMVGNSGLKEKLDLNRYVSDEVGIPTLQDILSELEKPGRDPRAQYEAFSFEQNVNAIEDLKVGMALPGIVTNVTKFGAFVDVGVHQDGLVHVSQLSDSYVSDPAKVVKLQQKVKVVITEIDIQRKRISMSMKSDPFGQKAKKRKKVENEQADGISMDAKLAMLKGKFQSK